MEKLLSTSKLSFSVKKTLQCAFKSLKKKKRKHPRNVWFSPLSMRISKNFDMRTIYCVAQFLTTKIHSSEVKLFVFHKTLLWCGLA